MEIIFQNLNWKVAIEILILWVMVYQIAVFLKGTRSVYILRGILILIFAFVVFQLAGLHVLTKLLTYFLAFFLIIVVVIFQPELREGLMRLGKERVFRIQPEKQEIENSLRQIVAAVDALSRKKTGALIAIKREMGLKNHVESGVTMNADLSAELMQNIFYPLAPVA